MHRKDIHKDKPHILGITTQELEDLVEPLGEPRFRGRQIAKWLYKHNAVSFDEMTDLPLSLRQRLKEDFVLYRAQVVNRSTSRDGTTKLLLKLEDNQTIESVIIPYEDRVSVCVSTQVGCAVRCVFCATGITGFVRNLTVGEIVDEVLTCQKKTLRRISHVVYMGMGEPLLNYDNVIKSIRILNKEIGISMRHITISTVGITPQIEKLAEEKLQLTLAVSLHAPDDMLRRQIIPLAARYPLHDLIEACRKYAETTGRRITFEYLLIRNVNDSILCARKLSKLLKGILCNVNLIPYNAVEGLALDRPSQAHVRAFRSVLEESGIVVTQRVERGHAISAACGQLRRRSQLAN